MQQTHTSRFKIHATSTMSDLKEKYELIKKQTGKSDKDFAIAFGYKSKHSFVTSARFDKVIEGIVFTYELAAYAASP